jgi:hypothetical protein
MSRKSSVTAIFGAMLAASLHPSAMASAPHCYPYNGSGYCQYDGRVQKAYINAYQQVILYFDTPMNTAEASAVGISGVTVDSAAVYNMGSNPDFGKSLFAAMLAAQARGATVSVQMSSASGGYLVMDRIWVNE